MTTYRIFPATNGPGAPTAYAGPFLAGVQFGLKTQGLWFYGYYWWVPTGGDTGAQKFALWQITSGTPTTQLIPGSVVTSGVLTANTWNYVPLATPIQISPGAQYIACTGWTSVNGFPNTNNQFGAAMPFVNGITNGPLVAYSDGTAGGTNNGPYGQPQGLFSSTTGNDPSVNPPLAGSNSANFWMDVSVSTVPPAGYTGSYRLRANVYDLFFYSLDTANNFTLGLEFSLSQPCAINNIWFYSPATVTQLPTSIGVFRVADQALIASNPAPSWSGAVASGWIKAALAGTLQAGVNYKIGVCNGAGVPAIWNGASAQWWGTGFGSAGETAGPITAPNNAGASPGQGSYNAGALLTYPNTTVGPFDYGLDIEVTPMSLGQGASMRLTGDLTITG